MSDFVNQFWSFYVAILTVASIIACWLLLKSQNIKRPKGEQVETTGHVWDGDLSEWNNPLPNWWRWMFYITIIFAFGYLAFYPGLGTWGGKLGWSSAGQYQVETAAAEARYGELYKGYASLGAEEMANNPAALAVGQNLYLNYCAGCHASDARGSKGFPNLADKDWLYGGDARTLHATIAKGRTGVMPPMGAALGSEGTRDVAHYVRSLSGLTVDSLRVARGKAAFAQTCAGCHGAEGKGNPMLGAPNLSDQIWLYGGSEETIVETITKGRTNVMPAWGNTLSDDKVRILAGYIWSLSNEAPKTALREVDAK